MMESKEEKAKAAARQITSPQPQCSNLWLSSVQTLSLFAFARTFSLKILTQRPWP